MAATTFDAFALTLFKDSILFPSEEKREIVEYILQTEEQSLATNPKEGEGRAWTGDTKGHEFLFRRPLFENLYREIGAKIRDYVEMLGVDSSQVEFFYQRSWATVTRRSEIIASHRHVQSNISFAYYPLKPENTGDIQFLMNDIPNEFSPSAFSGAKFELGFLREVNLRNTKRIDVAVRENDIVVFPSKTRHATLPNETDNPRISISGDVLVMLKDSTGHEHMMPHFRNWQEF